MLRVGQFFVQPLLLLPGHLAQTCCLHPHPQDRFWWTATIRKIYAGIFTKRFCFKPLYSAWTLLPLEARFAVAAHCLRFSDCPSLLLHPHRTYLLCPTATGFTLQRDIPIIWSLHRLLWYYPHYVHMDALAPNLLAVRFTESLYRLCLCVYSFCSGADNA